MSLPLIGLPRAVDRSRRCLLMRVALLVGGAGAARAGWAGLGLSDSEASSALRAALQRGAGSATDLLGRSDGFLANPKVHIPLPSWLDKPSRLLRSAGLGAQLDELVTTMNRAAESAVPVAKPVLLGAVQSLNIVDARKILTGGDQAVTAFFAEKTRTPLGEKFLPIITKSTERLDLTSKLNRLIGQAGALGLVKKDAASLEQYVTGKTLDGLYLMIGEEERRIRQDPVGTGSAVLRKVFGGLR
jgi:Protein of unknown function (DUF4197)